MNSPPNALTIAGSDSGGGAGIQADLKTFGALGVYGASVITAITAQNTREVRAIHDVPVGMIVDQLNAVFDDIEINAVKIGMLCRPEVIKAVADALDRHNVGNVVLDPVMIAKSGDKLLDDSAITTLRDCLIPRATVITPNLPEAGMILDAPPIDDAREMPVVAQRLIDVGAHWVVLKGGHLTSENCPDILMNADNTWSYDAPRIHTRNTHGTGCTLSSAITAYLARGLDIPESVERAKRFLQQAIRAADNLKVGHGHGPVSHFEVLWQHLAQEEQTDVETQ